MKQLYALFVFLYSYDSSTMACVSSVDNIDVLNDSIQKQEGRFSCKSR